MNGTLKNPPNYLTGGFLHILKAIQKFTCKVKKLVERTVEMIRLYPPLLLLAGLILILIAVRNDNNRNTMMENHLLTSQGAMEWLKQKAGENVQWENFRADGVIFNPETGQPDRVVSSSTKNLKAKWPAVVLVEINEDVYSLSDSGQVLRENDTRCVKANAEGGVQKKFCTNVQINWTTRMVTVYPQGSGAFSYSEPK